MLRDFFKTLPQRLLLPYRGRLWLWHIAAFAVTAIIVFGGFDWWYYEHTRSEALRPLVMIAGLGGMLIPIFLPVILYMRGKRKKDELRIRAAIGVAQASLIAWIIVAVYKAFTGRVQPGFSGASIASANGGDISRGFQFGFWEHGIFWGWPSHHTVVAIAAATVLYLAFKRPSARFAAFVWAAIVAAGASVGFHWFSDVVAGVIVGAVVGVAVWRDINDKINSQSNHV